MTQHAAPSSSADAIVGQGRLDTEAFVPMLIEDEAHGEVQFLRDDTKHDRVNRVAVWRLTAEQVPYESPYYFRNDETIVVLDGELEMTFDDGTVRTIGPGDVISVLSGTSTQWRIEKPFKKFVVEVGQ